MFSLLVFTLMTVKFSHQSDVTTCLHEYTYDYRYSKPYELTEVANVIKRRVFRLEVTILGKSDAHIRLTPHYFIEPGDIFYEIVLGAGGNTYSNIRKKPRNYGDLDWESTSNILSAFSPYTAAVVIDNERITVYDNKTEKIILSGLDARVIDVNYASFSAWNGVSVFFTFGCQKRSSSIQATVTPEEEESLTAVERWRRHFLRQYDPYAIPTQINDTLLVRMGISINFLSLDSKAEQLTTRGTFNISWIDTKLKWDPDDYEGLDEMFFETRSIWRPAFTLLDSANVEDSPLTGNAMRVKNTGQVIWRPSSELLTWCHTDESNTWPRDRHDCSIRLALYCHPESIQLSPMNDGNEFPLDSVNSHDLDIELASLSSETVIEQQPTSPITFGFKMSLQRRVNAFSVLFIIPLIAITAVTQSALYLPPSSNVRTLMHSITLLVLAVYLMAQERFLPPGKSIPLLMKLTSGAFMLAVVQLIYSTVISCLTQLRHPVPKRLLEFITAKWVNYVLFSPLDMYDEFFNDGQEQMTEPEPSASSEIQWFCVARFFDRTVQFASGVLLGVLYIMLMTL